MKKSKKILIIVLSVLVALLVLALALSFSYINTLKFATMTKSALNSAKQEYATRMSGDDPVKYIAHRGLSKEAYQNTEKAFLLAGQDENVWGIETDVWMTSDGGMVCMHDANDISGVSNVRDITLEQATTTPLRSNHEEYAPSIETYLNICKEYGKVAIVELKDSKMTSADIEVLLGFIEESGAKAKIISFHYDLLEMVRAKDSEIGLQALTASGNLLKRKTIERLISLRCDLSSNYEYLSNAVIDKFHSAGLKVGVWTVNSPKDAMCCVGVLGIDYVTTDIRMHQAIQREFFV